nr:V-type proton ATPase subunit G 1 [Pogona vitticeps]
MAFNYQFQTKLPPDALHYTKINWYYVVARKIYYSLQTPHSYCDDCVSSVDVSKVNHVITADLKFPAHQFWKNRRLKQAKEEAQAEIEQYRLQREKEFKAKEEAALGSHGSSTTEVEKETQEKMMVLNSNFQKNREEVLTTLLNLVCDIKPEIHMNYRING